MFGKGKIYDICVIKEFVIFLSVFLEKYNDVVIVFKLINYFFVLDYFDSENKRVMVIVIIWSIMKNKIIIVIVEKVGYFCVFVFWLNYLYDKIKFFCFVYLW